MDMLCFVSFSLSLLVLGLPDVLLLGVGVTAVVCVTSLTYYCSHSSLLQS